MSRDLRVYTVYILYLQITDSPLSYNEKLQKKLTEFDINIQRIIRSTFDTSANKKKHYKEADEIKMCSVWQPGECVRGVKVEAQQHLRVADQCK